MAVCAPKLATLLDQEWLEKRTTIAPRLTAIQRLPLKTGAEVADELGGRFLLRYIRYQQLRTLMDGVRDEQFVTPTAYGAEDAVSWLTLPSPDRPPTHLLLLDPAKLTRVRGPRWVRMGGGIEYILPEGFGREALALPWEIVLD